MERLYSEAFLPLFSQATAHSWNQAFMETLADLQRDSALSGVCRMNKAYRESVTRLAKELQTEETAL